MYVLRAKNQWTGSEQLVICNGKWKRREIDLNNYVTAQWFLVTGELALIPWTTWINQWKLFLVFIQQIKQQDIHRSKTW